jgi:glycerol-3-phosphate cytidylyltransferase-like family protein
VFSTASAGSEEDELDEATSDIAETVYVWELAVTIEVVAEDEADVESLKKELCDTKDTLKKKIEIINKEMETYEAEIKQLKNELVEYKGKNSVIPFEERIAIVSSLKCVTTAIPQLSLDKLKQWEKIKFDVLFVGDDWHGNPNWQDVENKLNDVGVKVIYLPYTKSTSSTLINEVLIDLRK